MLAACIGRSVAELTSNCQDLMAWGIFLGLERVEERGFKSSLKDFDGEASLHLLQRRAEGDQAE